MYRVFVHERSFVVHKNTIEITSDKRHRNTKIGKIEENDDSRITWHRLNHLRMVCGVTDQFLNPNRVQGISHYDHWGVSVHRYVSERSGSEVISTQDLLTPTVFRLEVLSLHSDTVTEFKTGIDWTEKTTTTIWF